MADPKFMYNCSMDLMRDVIPVQHCRKIKYYGKFVLVLIQMQSGHIIFRIFQIMDIGTLRGAVINMIIYQKFMNMMFVIVMEICAIHHRKIIYI